MKLKKYMLISMVAVTLASCGDDFLEEKIMNCHCLLYTSDAADD